MDNPLYIKNPTPEQLAAIEEGKTLEQETELPALLVAVVNKVIGSGRVGDIAAAKLVAAAVTLFIQLTTPVKGAVARPPTRDQPRRKGRGSGRPN